MTSSKCCPMIFVRPREIHVVQGGAGPRIDPSASSFKCESRKGAPQEMFERYTEKARRVIFFARYEASQFGSPYIESEHLLMGILREDKGLTNRFLRQHSS